MHRVFHGDSKADTHPFSAGSLASQTVSRSRLIVVTQFFYLPRGIVRSNCTRESFYEWSLGGTPRLSASNRAHVIVGKRHCYSARRLDRISRLISPYYVEEINSVTIIRKKSWKNHYYEKLLNFPFENSSLIFLSLFSSNIFSVFAFITTFHRMFYFPL